MTSEQQLQHFQNLRQLLRQEKEADHRAFLELVRTKPLSDRVENGYTWYPLQVVNTGFALSEKAFVIVERTTRLDAPHQLRSGQPVSLFSLSPDAEEPEKQGVINFVERNRMKIILNARDVPDWINAGQLGVDMLFDDRSYHEMDRALEKVMAAKGDRLAELRKILTPKIYPTSISKSASRQIPATASTPGANATGVQEMVYPGLDIPTLLVGDPTAEKEEGPIRGLN
ncbi:MAG: hypothetical protein Q7T20_04175, partial [Saprospiraceae bacterium]|nr:hypothetical protein [Saprospiraceae bacterium]